MKLFLIKYRLWGCRRRTSILCRENKEQETEERKQGVRGTMDTLSFLKILLYCGESSVLI